MFSNSAPQIQAVFGTSMLFLRWQEKAAMGLSISNFLTFQFVSLRHLIN